MIVGEKITTVHRGRTVLLYCSNLWDSGVCLLLYTVDPIYRGAWGPSSATAIYPDRDISWGGSLLRRR